MEKYQKPLTEFIILDENSPICQASPSSGEFEQLQEKVVEW